MQSCSTIGKKKNELIWRLQSTQAYIVLVHLRWYELVNIIVCEANLLQ